MLSVVTLQKTNNPIYLLTAEIGFGIESNIINCCVLKNFRIYFLKEERLYVKKQSHCRTNFFGSVHLQVMQMVSLSRQSRDWHMSYKTRKQCAKASTLAIIHVFLYDYNTCVFCCFRV